MAIKGLQSAIQAGIDRARRIKESICIVQIDEDEYVLWRLATQDSIGLVYKHYKIIKVIRYKA